MKILILGLGQYPKGSGIAAALYYARRGDDVLATDLKTEQEISTNVKQLKKFKNVRFRLGEHKLDDIRWADVIVRNPRVRSDSKEMRLASKLGKTVVSDISIFLELCKCPVVGVTGTRGKSTTSTLVADMLKASGKKTWLGGNILVSPLTFLKNVKSKDVVVLELSSWQLEATGDAGVSPGVACITNLMRDHLNSYDGMEAYGEAKAQIFRHQGPDDVVILNADDAFCRSKISEAPGQVVLFSKKDIRSVSVYKGFGEHIQMNMLAAMATAKAAGATQLGIKKALRAFKGLKDRQEVVTVKHGIAFINDTTATTPDATIAALRALSPRFKTLHLIIGGADKELEFDGLAKELKGMNVDLAVLPGTAYKKLTTSLKKKRISFDDSDTLAEAFKLLVLRAKKGDAVVLSPGCASFGLFVNEFDRGDQFRKLCKHIDN